MAACARSEAGGVKSVEFALVVVPPGPAFPGAGLGRWGFLAPGWGRCMCAGGPYSQGYLCVPPLGFLAPGVAPQFGWGGFLALPPGAIEAVVVRLLTPAGWTGPLSILRNRWGASSCRFVFLVSLLGGAVPPPSTTRPL